MRMLEEDYEKYHCRGVKIGPVYQGLHPHAPEYYKIYEYCEKHHLPIMTHMATTFSSGVPLSYVRREMTYIWTPPSTTMTKFSPKNHASYV